MIRAGLGRFNVLAGAGRLPSRSGMCCTSWTLGRSAGHRRADRLQFGTAGRAGAIWSVFAPYIAPANAPTDPSSPSAEPELSTPGSRPMIAEADVPRLR